MKCVCVCWRGKIGAGQGSVAMNQWLKERELCSCFLSYTLKFAKTFIFLHQLTFRTDFSKTFSFILGVVYTSVITLSDHAEVALFTDLSTNWHVRAKRFSNLQNI